MLTQSVHPANPSTIQSCGSPKLGIRAWVRTAKKFILASIKSESVHLIGLPCVGGGGSFGGGQGWEVGCHSSWVGQGFEVRELLGLGWERCRTALGCKLGQGQG